MATSFTICGWSIFETSAPKTWLRLPLKPERISIIITRWHFQPLINFEKQRKLFQLSIPTPEHYLPLIYTLGLKGKQEELNLFNDKLVEVR